MHRRVWIPGCAAGEVHRCKTAVNLAELTVDNLHKGETLNVNMINDDWFG